MERIAQVAVAAFARRTDLTWPGDGTRAASFAMLRHRNSTSKFAMIEINAIHSRIADLSSRVASLRGYL
jgi:hypothetical protein